VKTAQDNTMTVTFTLKNNGSVEGAEVPRVYLGINDKDEPPLRLVGWQKIGIKPGESRRVSIEVSQRMQLVWSVDANGWKYVPASQVLVGASSRDLRLKNP
jgi:beta-glucosidase